MIKLIPSLEMLEDILRTIRIQDVLDILIVAYLVYKLIDLLRETRAGQLIKGVLGIILVYVLSQAFQLRAVSAIIRYLITYGVFALLIIFQPELRRLLERMGSGFASGRSSSGTVMDSAISQTVQACCDMSASKTGALIIFERGVALNSIISTGTVINADTTAELLKNMFFNKALK